MRRRRHLLVLGAFLAVQLLDGALTYVGVRLYGIEVEANVLITTLMYAWGTGPALVAAKLFASACGVILFLVSVYRVLAAAAGACLGLAVVPWLITLGF